MGMVKPGGQHNMPLARSPIMADGTFKYVVDVAEKVFGLDPHMFGNLTPDDVRESSLKAEETELQVEMNLLYLQNLQRMMESDTHIEGARAEFAKEVLAKMGVMGKHFRSGVGSANKLMGAQQKLGAEVYSDGVKEGVKASHAVDLVNVSLDVALAKQAAEFDRKASEMWAKKQATPTHKDNVIDMEQAREAQKARENYAKQFSQYIQGADVDLMAEVANGGRVPIGGQNTPRGRRSMRRKRGGFFG